MVPDQVLCRAPSDPQISEHRFSSFVDQEKALPKFDQIYRQLTPGCFEGFVKSVDYGTLTLTHEAMNQGLEQQVSVNDGTVAIGFVMGAGHMYDLFKNEVFNGQVAVLPGGHEHVSYVAEKTEFVIASISLESVPEEMLSGRTLPTEVAKPVGAWIRGLIGMAGSTTEAKGLTTILPELVMDRLSLLFGYPEARVSRNNHHEVIVLKRILEACHELPAEELTVSRLSKHLGLPRTDLRRACQATTGFHLDDMLTSRRLSDVYRILREGSAGQMNVTQAALDHGFTHFGRFSAAYRKMFGERPSDTLRA